MGWDVGLGWVGAGVGREVGRGRKGGRDVGIRIIKPSYFRSFQILRHSMTCGSFAFAVRCRTLPSSR